MKDPTIIGAAVSLASGLPLAVLGTQFAFQEVNVNLIPFLWILYFGILTISAVVVKMTSRQDTQKFVAGEAAVLVLFILVTIAIIVYAVLGAFVLGGDQ